MQILRRRLNESGSFEGSHTSANMDALLACSHGATTDISSSNAPYFPVWPSKLPGTPVESLDDPAARILVSI